jgi:2,3-bisphosphoglycerate-dependent phosphoglycerate mutase
MSLETTIYLIRHAHAEWRDDDDRSLSEIGRRTAHLVADRLASRPIAALYTSPSARSRETIEPLAERRGLRAEVVADLRERELPVVAPGEFESLVRLAWDLPRESPRGGESNVGAQARGLAVLRAVVARHRGSQVVLATHGNLLTLMLNGLDPRFGYQFWRELSFPDIYQLTFDGEWLRSVERLWDNRAGPP